MTNQVIDREAELKQKSFRTWRRTWIPVIKSNIASLTDVVGDWLFYGRVIALGNNADLGIWLMTFSIISSVLGVFNFVAQIMHHWPVCIRIHNVHKTRFLKVVNYILLSEMFIEDVPQLVLTAIVWSRKNGGALDGVAVFNITTSSVNFVFNALDLLMPLEEEHYEEKKDDENEGELEY
mmetsp:Transcript_26037/g.32092  ORF Transcript_26037/g.32092 Transcript_26037/m.32092 type:complete len:179 (-) Transcript_26037:69-605(-)